MVTDDASHEPSKSAPVPPMSFVATADATADGQPPSSPLPSISEDAPVSIQMQGQTEEWMQNWAQHVSELLTYFSGEIAKLAERMDSLERRVDSSLEDTVQR